MAFERYDPKTIGITDQLREARREVTVRERVYERWVEDGRLDARTAAKQLAAMQAVVLTLEAKEREERLI